VTTTAPVLVDLVVSGDATPWRRLGFDVRGDALAIGATTIRLAPKAHGGILGWSLRGAGGSDVDGLPTRWVDESAAPTGGWVHPNSAQRLDHVVVTTPDLERTVAALESVGAACRRVREVEAGASGRPLRQAFFRLGEVILEVVGPPAAEGNGAAAFWGIVVVVEDLEACAQRLGDALGTVRDAVQPGRRIATVRPAAGLPLAVAFMSARL
jgi:glyoxalase/bleomycin resistance protein/dioxygenase superfamily protein